MFDVTLQQTSCSFSERFSHFILNHTSTNEST